MDCLNYPGIIEKKGFIPVWQGVHPRVDAQSYEQAFEIEYTHNSTAIEGNTLTLMETKVLLEDGITIGGEEAEGDL